MDPELLEEIANCGKGTTCPLKVYLAKKNESGKGNNIDKTLNRILVQLKCVELYKWDRGEEGKVFNEFDEVYMEWIDLGYAHKFHEIYNEHIRNNGKHIHPKEIYYKVKDSIRNSHNGYSNGNGTNRLGSNHSLEASLALN